MIVVMVVALMCATATARTGTITDGENAWLSNGSPAKLGQPTADHLFVRELGPNGVVINDCVAFDQGVPVNPFRKDILHQRIIF